MFESKRKRAEREFDSIVEELKQDSELYELTPFLWVEVKEKIIRAMRIQTKLDTGCHDNRLSFSTWMQFKLYRKEWEDTLPAEYFADLGITLRETARRDNPFLFSMIKNI